MARTNHKPPYELISEFLICIYPNTSSRHRNIPAPLTNPRRKNAITTPIEAIGAHRKTVCKIPQITGKIKNDASISSSSLRT